MSLTRKIILSVYMAVAVVLFIVLKDDFLWLKIVLFAIFLVGLFWPTRKTDKT